MSEYELLKLHSEEVRFQVQLGWDRAKWSLTFNAAVLLVAGSFSARGYAVALFAFTVVSSLLGARMVDVGHEAYRAARDRRKAVEAQLETVFGFVSTPGQRGEARSPPNITQILVGLHLLLAGLSLSLLGAAVYWRS